MRIFPAATLVLTLGMLTATSATSAESIIGSWSGRGTVRLSSGQVEPVSCKVSYEKGDSAGKTFTLDAKCSITAGTFVLYGRISKRSAGNYRGSLFNETVSGKIAISVRGNSQTVRVSNSRGTGSLKLRRR